MIKVIDQIFSLNSRRQSDIKVESSFIYNYYDEKETIDEDNKITLTSDSKFKNRFIKIKISNLNLAIDKFDYRRDNFVDTIYQLSLSDSLRGNQIKFFNKLDQISSKRKYIVNELDEIEKNKIKKFYDKDSLNSFDEKIKYSYRMSYLNPEVYDNNLHTINSTSDFPESDLVSSDNFYDDLITSNIEINREIKNYQINENGSLFNNLKVLNKSVNEIEDYTNDFSKYNGVRCGLLFEKYVFEEEKYKFLCGKFLTSDENADYLNINSQIEDMSVKYGKTYKYVIYNVYLYSELDPIDPCIINKYLICDHPYITKDIVCKEYEAPPPPNNIRFKVLNKDKLKTSLEISWDEPSDYQRDARGYQILKRNNLDSPFEVIAQLEGHSNNDLYEPEERVIEGIIQRTPGKVPYRFVDNNYERGKITIYAIRTIDAHGYFSNYSEQVAILYDPFEEKLIYDFIAYTGAKRNTPNETLLPKSMFFKYNDNFIDNLPISKNIKNITLYLTPDYQSVNIGDDKQNVFNNNEEFKFTIFRLNDLKKYEKDFKITNFI